MFTSTIFRAEDGREMTLRDAEPGAMWDARWMHELYRGADGRCLTVKLPDGHDWMIDGRASNCSRSDEPPRSHDCWCRHGEPPNITVDKNPEAGRSTCEAGGGSIQSPDWHGFLRDGELVEA